MQLDEDECLKISEIRLEGFLNGEDMLILSQMSKYGSLKRLDMSGVTEWDVKGLADLDDGECSGNHIPFYYNKRIEEVIFPSVDGINANMFTGCPNLRKVVLPKTLKWLSEEVLSSCPNIEEIHVPSNLELSVCDDYDSFGYLSFMGSGMKFVSDNDGWPKEMKDGEFFAYDGVLYKYEDGELYLYRYPAGDNRSEFTIPEGVTSICKFAFYQCHHLKKITVPKTLTSYNVTLFIKCPELETIIFKNVELEGYSYTNTGLAETDLKDLPHLKEIYLFAENPEIIPFVFNPLKNIGEVTLYVPRSCKEVYENYDVTFVSNYSYKKSVEKAYRRFHHIEEFDPADFC